MKKSIRGTVFILSFIVSMAISCMTAHAQYNDMSGASSYGGLVERRGANFHVGEEQLGEEQLAGLLARTDFTAGQVRNYQKGFKAGKGLLIGFGSLTGAGLITAGVGVVGVVVEAIALGVGVVIVAPIFAATGTSPDIQYKSKFQYVASAGLIATGVGILGLATGTTVYCVYKKRLNKVERALNARPAEMQLSFGAQKHGVGFALNF